MYVRRSRYSKWSNKNKLDRIRMAGTKTHKYGSYKIDTSK